MNTSVLKRIELRPTSIEQETFPAIVKDGLLHSFDLEGFWMDVGQPKDFLSGTCLYLSSLARRNAKLLTPASEPYVYGGNVLIDPSAKIGKNCRIGPNVTIGPDVVIGDGVRLQRCVLLKNSRVKDHAWVKSSIVGWNSTVGKWARLENITVLGDDVTIGDEVYVNGGSVLPHKSIKQNVDTWGDLRTKSVWAGLGCFGLLGLAMDGNLEKAMLRHDIRQVKKHICCTSSMNANLQRTMIETTSYGTRHDSNDKLPRPDSLQAILRPDLLQLAIVHDLVHYNKLPYA
ncbi:nucleotide-diphospho-sugar transferase [Alternaria alternata]|nr:nucleotide-diphospho-sugar transferase [Alternaria alternata]